MEQYLVELGMMLTRLVGEFSVDYVSSKIKIAKETKDVELMKNTYEEVINSLLSKNNDITRIAQEYKILYEKVNISDQDIDYLQSTIKSAIGLLSQFMPQNAPQESIDIFLKLISKETLKTMQLLGFNYKEAIGEPLTDACANLIRNSLNAQKPKQLQSKR